MVQSSVMQGKKRKEKKNVLWAVVRPSSSRVRSTSVDWKALMAAAPDTRNFSAPGVLLAQIRKNLTLMTTTSQLPKLLIYSAVSSEPKLGARFLLGVVPGFAGQC